MTGIVAFVACALAVAQLLSALFGFWDGAASKQGLAAAEKAASGAEAL